jgi:uncharacterized protein (TIGR00369 family)
VHEGAYVFITGRREPELAAVRAIGNNVAGVQGDVSNLDFLKPVWQARLHAIGRVVTHGRTIGLVECDILDAQEALVARASSTCMTLRGDQARGR